MALQSSGQISFSDIATELGLSLTNGVDMRGMSSDAGFSTPDSISEFYGYSDGPTILDTQTVTVGSVAANPYFGAQYGYSSITGSISDGTSNIYSGAAITICQWQDMATGQVLLSVQGTRSNSGWTTMTIAGTSLNRADASFAHASGLTSWTWTPVTTNPFGTSVGATKTVEFT